MRRSPEWMRGHTPSSGSRALIALDAGPPSYMSAVERGLDAGASYDEIVGTLIAVIPIVGIARVVSAAPDLALALGYDVAERWSSPQARSGRPGWPARYAKVVEEQGDDDARRG